MNPWKGPNPLMETEKFEDERNVYRGKHLSTLGYFVIDTSKVARVVIAEDSEKPPQIFIKRGKNISTLKALAGFSLPGFGAECLRNFFYRSVYVKLFAG